MNLPYIGRRILGLNYIYITINTYVQNRTVMEIIAKFIVPIMVTPALNIIKLLSDINTVEVIFMAKKMSVIKIHPSTCDYIRIS